MASARAVLLLLTVWLFAAAWSGDRPVESADAAVVPCAPPETTSGLDLGPLVQRDGSAVNPSPFDRVIEARMANASMQPARPAHWLSSLPQGVTAGTYLVVYPNGSTERVTIEADFLHAHGHDPDLTPQATHSLSHKGTMLTLVRIAAPSAVIAEGVKAPQRF